MEQNVCTQCGAPIEAGAEECKFCGERIVSQRPKEQQVIRTASSPVQQTVYIQQSVSAIDPTWPVKSKIVAGVLAILLGGLGIQYFYLGKIGKGVLCILFCWTYIPSIIGLVMGIIYLCSNDENFQLKHHVRIQ